MRLGYLSQYFSGVAAKKLTAVEINPKKSNQHEIQGIQRMREMFGTEKRRFDAQFLYLDDTEDKITAEGSVTWYDVRAKNPNRSAEFRLYYTSTDVSRRSREGDFIVVGLRSNGKVLVVIAAQNSTTENQLKWLFGFLDANEKEAAVRTNLSSERDRLSPLSDLILEQLDIEVSHQTDVNFLEDMRHRFGDDLPSTTEFSSYARETLPDVDALTDPDAALIAWLEREEGLFRAFEKYLVTERLAAGFWTDDGEPDVDSFISYSLSVQNRRKSRAGRSLENHLMYIFNCHKVRYSYQAITENRSTPDFIFPGATYYHQAEFNPDFLTMLGVKRTCKDRWRQVLSEANRIRQKHLFTIEPAISEQQTTEMASHGLTLVLPSELHASYNRRQQDLLMSLSDFVKMVKKHQLDLGI